MSAVEDVATAIAATVRKHGLYVARGDRFLVICGDEIHIQLGCQDASQAKRLAEMMRGKE